MSKEPGSHQLRQHSHKPLHHYKRTRPGIDQEADEELEKVVRWLMDQKGLTRERATEEARHWV